MPEKKPSSTHSTDILIVGGGLVGSSLALALSSPQVPADKALRITLVEAIEIQQDSQPSFDDRSTVLSQSSANLLSDSGLWSQLATQSTAIKHIHTSDQGLPGITRLHAQDYKLEAMGYVISNRVFGKELYNLLEQTPNVERLIPAKVTELEPHASHYACQIEMADNTKIVYDAKLVVLCDGGRSPLMKQLGLQEKKTAYGQAALIANIGLSQPHKNWAYERFTQKGPIAMLPLSDDQAQPRAALVWTTPQERLDQRLALDDSAFLGKLQQEFGYRLGRFNYVGERTYYPLSVQKVEELVRSRLVVMGNAAHTLHPVAGQGLNLALRGAFLLAQTLLTANERQTDIGSLTVLKKFAQSQAQDRDRVQWASHSLINLFGSESKAVTLGRNIGLLGLDHSPLLKMGFVRAAMGLDVSKPTFRSTSSKFE